MIEHQDSKSAQVENSPLAGSVELNLKGRKGLLERAEHAIALRRATKKVRKNKPLTFSTPNLWSPVVSVNDD